MIIVRGTTPSIVSEIPEDIDMSRAVEVWFSISQLSKLIADDTFSNGSVAIDGQQIEIELTQEQTLALKVGVPTNIGIRILLDDGEAFASYDPEPVVIKDIVKGGVITNGG